MNLLEYFVYITIVVCSWIVFSSQQRNYLSNYCSVSVFSDFRVDVCVCVYIRTHTHTMHVGYLDVSPRGRDETLKEPGKSRWTKSQDMYIYIFARRRDEILD